MKIHELPSEMRGHKEPQSSTGVKSTCTVYCIIYHDRSIQIILNQFDSSLHWLNGI